MYLFVIDPGHTTGVAEFVDGILVDTWSSVPPHDELRRALVRTERLFSRPVEVVIEQGPVNRKQADTCAEVEAIIAAVSPTNLNWVRASQWKGHPSTLRVPSEGKTKHERDAECLGRWFLHTRSHHASNEEARHHTAHATGSNT